MNRHTAFVQADIDRLALARPLRLARLKRQWLEALDQARRTVEALPAHELGCLYLDKSDIPVSPDPAAADFDRLQRHVGRVRGAWPKAK